MVEWALFYRALQGVSHVYVCDHGSTDGAHLLTDLFASHGIDGIVVEPAPQVLRCSAGYRVSMAATGVCLRPRRRVTSRGTG